MKITIGINILTATIYNNATATALNAKLQMTNNMTELNRNEKYNNVSATLPTRSSNLGTIHAGALMLWGSNCILIFYKTFQTFYRYIKINRVDYVLDLKTASGKRNVTVTFQME